MVPPPHHPDNAEAPSSSRSSTGKVQPTTSASPPRRLLAVDLGVRTGLAIYDNTPTLVAYLSHNYGSSARLRRGVHAVLADLPTLDWLIIEGGGRLADIWLAEARRRQITVRIIGAENWRQALLRPRDQRTGELAKRAAIQLARRVIEHFGAPRPTALRHDTAEAILIGLWSLAEIGWLASLPAELKQ